MSTHGPFVGSAATQRFHWYLYVIGNAPSHEPMLEARAWPTIGPESPEARMTPEALMTERWPAALMNAIRPPSGEYEGEVPATPRSCGTEFAFELTLKSSPADAYTIVDESGDQLGPRSSPATPFVTWTATPPVAGIVQ